jgi:N-methylhydantoinase B
MPVDPITRSVVQHRLSAVVAEMGEAMLRTSYSQILNSSRDFSMAICDADCRLVAQADHIPVHVGALPFAARAVEDAIPEIRPGDVFLLNDPYRGGSHLPDLTALVPVFDGERRLFWTVVRAHQGDIGGATHGGYNPRATEIWQEGLRVPPVKLYDGGRLRADLLDLLALNVRHPRDFRGDLSAMVGAAHLGERRLGKLFEEVGARTVVVAVDAMLDAAEAQARAVVATWADGVFRGEAALDDDGHGREDIRIVAEVTKRGSDVVVDLSGSDPQAVGFVNSSHANMQSAVAMAFAFLLDPEIPKNAGAFRPLTVAAKPGTVVWAEEGAPVTLCTSHPSNEIVEAVIKALSQSCPDRAMAGWGRRFRVAIQGKDPRNGRRFIWHLFHARPGGGASSAGDGWSSIGEWHSVGGIKFGSVEVAEARFPLHFRRHEFRPRSGGDGRHRGGLGVDLDLVVETAEPALANTAGDGVRHGACGLLGGADGATHDYALLSEGRPDRVLKTKETGIEIRPGDMLCVRSGGGGGWGAPERRPEEARARDRREGLA